MGAFYFSVHFKTDDAEAVRKAVEKVVGGAGGRALVTRPLGGWVNVYPAAEMMGDPDAMARLAAASGVEHAIAFMVHDSDILLYWYFRAGQLADHYNSAPDYFGETDETEMAAAGDPAAFAAILDEDARRRLWELIGTRLVGGELVGDIPPEADGGLGFDFEEDRLQRVAEVLGIVGAMGSYEYLMNGEDVEGVGGKDSMVEVG